MDLWIRSQDRETLTKTEILVIEDNMIVDYYQKRIILGEYKTKERALEVLDEITDFIDGLNKTNTITIYEMPKE